MNSEIATRVLISAIASSPPTVNPRHPLDPCVKKAITAMKISTPAFANISSFPARFNIISPRWPRLLSWIVALLQSLDVYETAHPLDRDTTDSCTACIHAVMSFLNTIGPIHNGNNADKSTFFTKLMASPRFVKALARLWILAFKLPWRKSTHQEVVTFLDWFGDTSS
ncbi:hypothetical protein FB446DRAFT_796071, partial [Lentinula raphanica]